MTVLEVRSLRVRAAAPLLKPEVLVAVVRSTQRMIAEVAVCHAGDLRIQEGRDPRIVWSGPRKGEPSALRACRAAWDLTRRFARRQEQLARQHGVALCPSIGIASDGRETDAPGEEEERISSRARVLRQANLLFGTAILVDSVAAVAAERRMAFREVDRLGGGGRALLRSPEAALLAGITPEELRVFRPASGAVHELLGPCGVVPLPRQSAALAFTGALEQYHAGEWSRAATLFALLSEGPHPDRLAGLYLRKCRQHQEEDARLAAVLAADLPTGEPRR